LKIHILKKNDTLLNLANKYNVELDAIIAINPQIQDPTRIDAGMKVKIPARPQPVEPPSSDYAHKHIVKQGDSLWKLGKAWEIPLQAMIKANPQLKNPNVLMTGEIVYIPKLDSTQMNQGQGNKVSTMPYPQTSPMQAPMPGLGYPQASPMHFPGPEFPMMPQQQMPYAMPQYQGPMGDISTPAPAMPSMEDVAPAQPMPAVESKVTAEEPSSSMPSEAPQEQIKAESYSPDLSEPYQQAQHPFAQFQIKAAEGTAYSEPLEYGGEKVASNIPEMPPTYGGYQPVSGAYPSYQPQPVAGAYPAYQAQPAYNVKDCGCGAKGTESYAQPWNAYSAHPPLEMPYSPYQMQQGPGMYPYSMMPVPYYPMTSGEYHPGFTYGAGHPDTGYAYPASTGPSQSAPQAHIHQWPENQAQEEQQDREASAGKNNISKSSGKSAGTSKKTNSKKQQTIREVKTEQKVNHPWINV
jgi:morphogenetic protein associated with SpoVID